MFSHGNRLFRWETQLFLDGSAFPFTLFFCSYPTKKRLGCIHSHSPRSTLHFAPHTPHSRRTERKNDMLGPIKRRTKSCYQLTLGVFTPCHCHFLPFFSTPLLLRPPNSLPQSAADKNKTGCESTKSIQIESCGQASLFLGHQTGRRYFVYFPSFASVLHMGFGFREMGNGWKILLQQT